MELPSNTSPNTPTLRVVPSQQPLQLTLNFQQLNITGQIVNLNSMFMAQVPQTSAPVLNIVNTSRQPDFLCMSDWQALGCIYKLTSPDGKGYIGQAKLVKYKDGNLYRYGAKGRWNDHVSSSKMSDRDTLINQAIRALTPDAFTVEILEVAPIVKLDSLEADYIMNRCKTIHPYGYNIERRATNRHTDGRMKLPDVKELLLREFTPDELEKIKKILQDEIDDEFYGKMDRFKDKTITRIRIATAQSYGSRQDGKTENYLKAIVYVYILPAGTRAVPVAFGGVNIPIRAAHQRALKYAKRLSAQCGIQVEDQVKY